MAQPPVCRIMDFGKFLYQQKKKAHDSRKKQKTIRVKEVKFRPNVDDHDYDFKKNHAIRFLKEGNRVGLLVFGLEVDDELQLVLGVPHGGLGFDESQTATAGPVGGDFGSSVAISGNTAIIGAPDEDLTAIKADAGFVTEGAGAASAQPIEQAATPTIVVATTEGNGRVKASPLAKR